MLFYNLWNVCCVLENNNRVLDDFELNKGPLGIERKY